MTTAKYFMHITSFLLGAIFFVMTPVSVSAQLDKSSPKLKLPDVDVEIELGRPKKGCTGIGVCKIRGGTGLISGALSLNQADNQPFLEVAVLTIKSIPNEIAQMHFYRDGKLTTTYLLGDELMVKLDIGGKERDVLLRSGNYKVTKVKNSFVLTR